MEKRYNRGIANSGVLGYRFKGNFNSNHKKKLFNLYRPMLMEIDAIKRKSMYRKLKKGYNKKALKCYSYSKLGHFARDYRSKNIVSRL